MIDSASGALNNQITHDIYLVHTDKCILLWGVIPSVLREANPLIIITTAQLLYPSTVRDLFITYGPGD